MQATSLIGLPIYTIAKYRGIGMAVKNLRKLGIAQSLNTKSRDFRDLGDVKLSEIETDVGPPNLRNFAQFQQDTERIIQATSKVDSDDFVVCIGGECALVVGSLAAFRMRFKGQPGMLWMDAHGDFNTPKTTNSGFISGMCLAFACGRWSKATSNINVPEPLLDEENLVHFAGRTFEPQELKAMQSSRMRVYSISDVYHNGCHETAREAAHYLAERSDWIVCHLDVDSIDPSIIASVNFSEAGGLVLEEVREVIDSIEYTQTESPQSGRI
jgi:arginase